jgi:hypothetical protein
MLHPALLLFILPQAEAVAAGADQIPFPAATRVEVQANTFESNRQVDPALAADAAGNVLTVWSSRRQELGSFGVFAQLLDPRGRPLTTEIHVNTTLTGYQGKPSVTFLADGSAWIAWQSVSTHLSECGIYVRRFGWQVNESGERSFAPLSDEARIHGGLGDNPADVAVVALDGGTQWLAAWAVDTLDGRRRLLAQRFELGGASACEPFLLGQQSALRESLVSLDGSAAGAVAVWSEQNFAGEGTRLTGVRILKDALHPFDVARASEGFQVEPCVSVAQDGTFVVAFMSSQDGENYSAMARRFSADAKPLGEAFRVDAGGMGYRNGALVASAPDGSFLVAYNAIEPKLNDYNGERPAGQSSIRAQRFAADGSRVGAPFRLNQHDEGEQTLQVGVNAQHMLWTEQGQILAAWSGETGRGDGNGIGVTMILPDSLQPPAPAPIAPVAAAAHLSLDEVYTDQKAPPIWDPFYVPSPYSPPPPAAGGTGGFQGSVNTGWTPPDPDLAVGPDHVVTVVNGEIAIFDKAGNKSFGQSIVAFWQPTGAGGFVFDPVAFYDAQSGRYFVAAADGAGSNDAICLAVSDDSNPNGTWFKYRFAVSGTCSFLDFPNFGVNNETIFISGDCFNGGGNRIFMWEKSKVIANTGPTMRQLQANGSTQSLGATKNYDDNVGYFCTTYSGASNRLKIQAVRNANTSPTLSTFSLTVPTFSNPNDAVQQGTSNRADTIDWRIKNGVVRNGNLWVCHNNGTNGRSSVRWYQIDLNGWPVSGSNPTLTQSGDVDPGSGQYCWFGDINVTSTNDAVIAFNRSSSSQFISIEFVYRLVGDTLGTMRAPERLQISTGPENGSRYGDYAGVEQDPTSDTKFWSAHEYVSSGWRVWIGGIELSNQTLTLSATTLIGGAPAIFTVEDCLPGETTTIFGAVASGSYCPPGYGGLCLELGGVTKVVGTAVANGVGIATVSRSVPSQLSGRTVYLQAASIRGVGGVTSVKSNRIVTLVN